MVLKECLGLTRPCRRVSRSILYSCASSGHHKICKQIFLKFLNRGFTGQLVQNTQLQLNYWQKGLKWDDYTCCKSVKVLSNCKSVVKVKEWKEFEAEDCCSVLDTYGPTPVVRLRRKGWTKSDKEENKGWAEEGGRFLTWSDELYWTSLRPPASEALKGKQVAVWGIVAGFAAASQ